MNASRISSFFNPYRRRAYRVLCLLLCFFIACMPIFANAEASIDDVPGALLAEARTLQRIQEQQADTPRGIAGLSKLPALLVICEAVDQGKLDPTAEISISDRAASIGGPTAFIEGGERIAAKELLKAAAMICAGDAIVALGEALSGSESAFLERINARMRELGIEVALTDAIGSGLALSPNMLAQLGSALMESSCFTSHCTLTLENITHPDGRETELVNANKLLKTYAGCTGLATGSSQTDGYCGLFAATRGDTSMFCVVLGARNSSERFGIASALLDHAFATIKSQPLATKGEVIKESVRVQGGLRREVNLVAKETVVALLEKSAAALQAVEDIPEYLVAPLQQDAVVGSISYQTQDGLEIAKVELVPQQPIEEAHLRDFIRNALLGYLRI